ncbi:hypothetical protein R0K30_21850, partial [Bacillus sp. SIMBA_154]|uniref:hypothetical protein n=1 Tax=Bacillus sp. SIMBA_154 TaxID=3080859 RepID=UPI00397D7CDA
PVSGDESAVSLQRLVNSYEGSLAQYGVDPEGVIYSSNFTTQSVGDVLNVVKQQIAGQFTPSLTLNNSGNTVADTMAANNLTAPPSAALAN